MGVSPHRPTIKSPLCPAFLSSSFSVLQSVHPGSFLLLTCFRTFTNLSKASPLCLGFWRTLGTWTPVPVNQLLCAFDMSFCWHVYGWMFSSLWFLPLLGWRSEKENRSPSVLSALTSSATRPFCSHKNRHRVRIHGAQGWAGLSHFWPVDDSVSLTVKGGPSKACLATRAGCHFWIGWGLLPAHVLKVHVCWNQLFLSFLIFPLKCVNEKKTNKNRKQSCCSVTELCNSLWPHGLQHTRLPCSSPSPRAFSNSHPLSWWCHLAISSSVVPFSSCLQFSPASGSFPMSRLFASGGQDIGASASVPPMNIQAWFPLGLTGLISLQSKGFSRKQSNWCQWKIAVYNNHPLPKSKPQLGSLLGLLGTGRGLEEWEAVTITSLIL